MDFMTFFGRKPQALLVVPKNISNAVGDDGFKKGRSRRSLRFVRSNPGSRLVLEFVRQYWRKTTQREAPDLQDRCPTKRRD